jgi:hypothetical protein
LLSQAYLAGFLFPEVVKALEEADRELTEGPAVPQEEESV